MLFASRSFLNFSSVAISSRKVIEPKSASHSSIIFSSFILSSRSSHALPASLVSLLISFRFSTMLACSEFNSSLLSSLIFSPFRPPRRCQRLLLARRHSEVPGRFRQKSFFCSYVFSVPFHSPLSLEASLLFLLVRPSSATSPNSLFASPVPLFPTS